MRRNFANRSQGDIIRRAIHILQIPLRIQIVHRNAGTRHDVVKMVKQQILPAQQHAILRVRPPVQQSQRRELLRIQNIFFRSPDPPLGLRLGGKDAAMILEIQFAIPRRNLHAGQLFLHVGKEIPRKTELQLGKYGVGILQLLCMIQHHARRPAPVVAHPVQVHHFGTIR